MDIIINITFIQYLDHGKVNYNFGLLKKNTNNSKVNIDDTSLPTSNVNIPISENPQTKFRKIEIDEIETSLLVFC